MRDFKYCPMCKASLEKKILEGRERRVCGGCGWIHYRNPLPVVSCLVLNKSGDILLIKRGIEPYKGHWALPGGFIEWNETIPDAGRRELFEETGVRGTPRDVVGLRIHESRMYGSILTIGMNFSIDSEDLRPGDDAEDAKFFPKEEIPEIPIASQRDLVSIFLSK